MKRLSGESYQLKVLNALMTSTRPLSTNQLCDIAGCERKTLYKIIDTLEASGFGIEIIRTYQHNEYRLRGVY